MERKIKYNSDGLQIAGVLFEPEAAPKGSCPGVVMCQGMVGVKEYFWFPTIARRLVELGYVALIWDYRGVGESDGAAVPRRCTYMLDPPRHAPRVWHYRQCRRMTRSTDGRCWQHPLLERERL